MKMMTLRQRLNATQAILIGLLLLGGGVALRIEQSNSSTAIRRGKLDHMRDRVFRDVLQIRDAVRGLILEQNNDSEKKLRQDAQEDLANAVRDRDFQSVFSGNNELIAALGQVRDFGMGRLRLFHDEALQIAATNQTAAINYYTKNFPDRRDQLAKLFGDLNQQVEKIENADAIRSQTVAIVGLSCIVVITAIAFFVVIRFHSSAVTQPLSHLVTALDHMRQGDFTGRLALDRKDEFGVLADGLNRVADDLSSIVGQVQRSGIQVNTTATEIAATAREQQSTANQIAATTAEIGATSKEISATSRELVKTMNEVSQVSEDTAQLANSGQSAIARMEATMRQIMDASGSITAKLAVLSEKTTNINSVVTTITKVADQTNLLSLNAAIEAEKAGEYGLGFAVVAMEIRRLADQTAVATYDIEKMVKEMQSAVAAGVMGMDKFSEEVRRGVEEIRQVSTQLAQIIHQVQTLTPRFQTVNEGMHAQATGAQQISETLVQLSDAAHQTAESLRQSNLAIEQLNEAARGLQTSVARFKLDNH